MFIGYMRVFLTQHVKGGFKTPEIKKSCGPHINK